MRGAAVRESAKRTKRSAGKGRQVLLAGALFPLALASGCSVHVQKGDAGEDKDVSVKVPFADIQVHKNRTGPVDLGLPAYPGAVLSPGSDSNDKSVDVQVGFAQWKIHVQVLRYTSPDAQAKIEEFYRKALSRYGAVLTCRAEEPVGTPTRTGEGLTCRDNRNNGQLLSITSDAHLELKAGSERRQHIVSFENIAAGSKETQFSLIALELPSKGEKEQAGKEE